MTRKKHQSQAAQNQHYVPQFILRNFLSNEEKQQVSVFRKSTGTGFVTSIRNIMAERRFHEFTIGENYLASFEDSIGKIEEKILPAYRKLLQERRLSNSPEERAALAFFIAFQMLRTRQQRDQFLHIENLLKKHMEKIGSSIYEIEGYKPLNDHELTLQHINLIRNGIGDFSQQIAIKDFLLLEPPAGRSFYLADNPVCMNNQEPAHPFYGNIGLSVKGIEIYLPLSANLMIAAWCPTLIENIQDRRMEVMKSEKRKMLEMVIAKTMSQAQMREKLDAYYAVFEPANKLISCFNNGIPLTINDENMDYHNSLQMTFAREYVICKQGDFKLAGRFVKDFPNHKGKLPTLS